MAIKSSWYLKYRVGSSILVLLFVLPACTSQKQSGVVDAAATPLRDLNLAKIEIPEVLKKAQVEPYGVPADMSCESLGTIVSYLDEVLEPDLDAPSDDNEESLVKRGTNRVEKAAVGGLRSAAENLVPYRGWVRKLSGAERHSKRVEAAIFAGTVRRAFIKGIRISQNCHLAPLEPL